MASHIDLFKESYGNVIKLRENVKVFMTSLSFRKLIGDYDKLALGKIKWYRYKRLRGVCIILIQDSVDQQTTKSTE